MEKELIELFESAKRAAIMADNSPGEVDRCVDAIKRLKKFPVNYQVLVSTQVGKRLRQLTKHKCDEIKSLASDVVEIWKGIIVKETTKSKNGSSSNDKSMRAEPSDSAESSEHKKIKTTNNAKIEQKSMNKHVMVEKNIYSGAPNSDKLVKSETSSSLASEKTELVQTRKNAAGEQIQVNMKVKEETSSQIQKQASDPVGPPKLFSLVYCKDSTRDKLQEIIAEALCKVSGEVDDGLREKADSCDPYRVAVLTETAMFEKWGKSTGTQKFKYRSQIFVEKSCLGISSLTPLLNWHQRIWLVTLGRFRMKK